MIAQPAEQLLSCDFTTNVIIIKIILKNIKLQRLYEKSQQLKLN